MSKLLEYKVIIDGGKEIWYDENDQIHRENGPAYRCHKDELYYKHGKLHRLDGPAYKTILFEETILRFFIDGVEYFDPYNYWKVVDRINHQIKSVEQSMKLDNIFDDDFKRVNGNNNPLIMDCNTVFEVGDRIKVVRCIELKTDKSYQRYEYGIVRNIIGPLLVIDFYYTRDNYMFKTTVTINSAKFELSILQKSVLNVGDIVVDIRCPVSSLIYTIIRGPFYIRTPAPGVWDKIEIDMYECRRYQECFRLKINNLNRKYLLKISKEDADKLINIKIAEVEVEKLS